MTIDEAKASLKALCHTCKHFPTCVNDKPECFQAIEMAIKSLEAWGKLRSEIMAIGNWRNKSEISDNGVKDCLAIIDRHIAEIRG